MIIPILLAGAILKKRVGDQPNIPIKVNPKNPSWQTVMEKKHLCLQKHGSHGRILNKEHFQIAWGSLSAMSDKFHRLISDSFLKPGDVIGISRGFYYHYGIYIGNQEIIHLAGSDNIKSKNISVKQVSLHFFLKDSPDYFVLHFPKEGGAPQKLYPQTALFKQKSESRGLFDFLFPEKYVLFSPEETVARAKSRLGKVGYHLTRSNCEHFALWCKTGIKQSRQVDAIFGELLGI